MSEIIVAGGDEAGRGAVLGPLVIGVVAVRESREKKLADIGIRDSKLLTRRKREFVYDEIYSIAEEVKSYKISASEINSAMKSNISLNELEAIHFTRLMDSLECDVRRIYLDSPDVIQERFGVRIGIMSKKPVRVDKVKGKRVAKAIKIISEHKADTKYPVTSAASIVAKVERDRGIDSIIENINIDIGSGYPSDKKTIGAIRSDLVNHVLAPYIRVRWKTMDDIRQFRISDFVK